MKKTIVTVAIAAFGFVAAQAQGLVHFNNSNATLISTNTAAGGAATGVAANLASGGSFYFALFAAASGTTVGGGTNATMPSASSVGTYVWDAANSASWTSVALGTNNATAGRFASTTADSSANTALTGLAAGTAYSMVVVGWSADLGSTLAAMESAVAAGHSGILGESVVGTITPGNGVGIPSSAVFGTGSPFIQGFTLGALPTIPEPGTLALAALGGASLLLFRRKK